jgi:hypothetical protein
MNSTNSDLTCGQLNLDRLPTEILIRIFSFVFETYTPCLCKVGIGFDRWKATRFPRSSHLVISCFSGTVEHDVPFLDRRRLDPIYIRLQCRLNEYLGSRIKRHVYRMGGSHWIPSLMHGLDTRHPVALEFRIRAIFDVSFWKCIENVPILAIINGALDEKLEAWLGTEIPQQARAHKYHNMAGFVEYPWSQAPKNVEIYLTAHCAYSVLWLRPKFPLVS